MIRAVLLDRDGVLNVDHHYVNSPDRFQWIEGAPEAVHWLNEQGILVIVVTNQSGIGRGLYSMDAFERFSAWMDSLLAERGARIDAVYVCPHHPTDALPPYLVDCECRKPKPGMILQALREHDLRAEEAILIGDKDRDVAAAEAAGVKGIKYTEGNLLDLVQSALAAQQVSS